MITPEGYSNETPLVFSDNRSPSFKNERWIQELLSQGVKVGDTLIAAGEPELKLTLRAVIPASDGEHDGLIVWYKESRRTSQFEWTPDSRLLTGANLYALTLFRYKSEEDLLKGDYKKELCSHMLKKGFMSSIGPELISCVADFTFDNYRLSRLKDHEDEN